MRPTGRSETGAAEKSSSWRRGKEVARFFSLWAVNLAVRRAGGTDVSTGAPSFSAEMDPERLVRRDFGTTVVAID
jgi:hypothetical protein